LPGSINMSRTSESEYIKVVGWGKVTSTNFYCPPSPFASLNFKAPIFPPRPPHLLGCDLNFGTESLITNSVLYIVHFIHLWVRSNAFPIWISLMTTNFSERNDHKNISHFQLTHKVYSNQEALAYGTGLSGYLGWETLPIVRKSKC
jgi:hypothetical protein